MTKAFQPFLQEIFASIVPVLEDHEKSEKLGGCVREEAPMGCEVTP